MEKERFMVIDNQKGVVIPLQAEKTISIDKLKGTEVNDQKEIQLEDKVNKIQMLIKALVKQSIRDTIKEYNLQLTEELKEYESNEMRRWDKLEEKDARRWEKLEETDIERWKKLEEKEVTRWNELKENNEKYLCDLQEIETEHLEKIRKEEEKHWRQMEEHFKSLDKSIRQKQDEGKRKKHSIF